jgi:uncharacterized SAM-binding protein YcdF (DUF218 family)
MKRRFLFIKAFLLLLVVESCSYSGKTTRRMLEQVKGKRFDVIVVPGVPLENGKWSRTMKARIYWAKYLYDKGIAKNLMFSGSAVYTPYYEGIVMALYANALGIPKEHLYSETRAEHSTENIYYSYLKAKKLGFNTIALASDPFQTKLLKRFTRRKVSPEVVMLPMVKDTLKMMEPAMTDPQIPIDEAFKPGFVSIRKREGFFKRLRGTLGYHLPDTGF